MRFLLSLALTGVAALSMAQFSSPRNAAVNPIQWSVLGQGDDSRITGQENRIFSRQQDLDLYYARMCGSRPGTVVRCPIQVDWMFEDVMIVHLGQRQTGGFSLWVESIQRVNAWDWGVYITEYAPHVRSVLPSRINNPFIIIRLARATGVPQFTWRTIRNPSIVSGNCTTRRGCQCSCCKGHPGGGTPVWRLGPGGTLIPLNEAAGKVGG